MSVYILEKLQCIIRMLNQRFEIGLVLRPVRPTTLMTMKTRSNQYIYISQVCETKRIELLLFYELLYLSYFLVCF